MKKIAFVTTLMPKTHYSRYLIEGLCNIQQNIFVYYSKDEKLDEYNCGIIRQVWSKSILYPFQIIKQEIKDSIEVVHIQHEINMYGGTTTAVVFPLFVLLQRFLRIKTIVTIHGVVSVKEVNREFLKTFSKRDTVSNLFLIKIFFKYIYSLTGQFSNIIIVHSEILKSILTEEYKIASKKIHVIPHGVPTQHNEKISSTDARWWEKLNDKKIILSFGYVVKRKGIEDLIRAFLRIHLKYPEYVLVIAGGTLKGNEDYVTNLKKIIVDNNAQDGVVFTSFIEAADIQKLHNLCEFVIIPAKYSISASGPFAQAISYHKSIIATNIGVLKEEMQSNKIGLLYNYGDSKSLEGAISYMIENPSGLFMMEQNVKSIALKRSWEKIAERTYSLYLA